jgi:NTE family protein
MRLDVDEIVKVYSTYDVDQIALASSDGMPDRDSTPSFLRRELERIQQSFASVTRLATKFGWYSSDYSYEWMQEIVAKYGRGDGKATFAQFRRWGFRDLHVVVTNLSTHAAEVFSAATTPNVAVVDALLMTQALPLVFEALQFDGRKFGQGDFYSDGGILVNYPLLIFDEHSFALRNRWFVNGVNWETLGCRSYTPADCPKRSRKITNLLSFSQNVLEALIETQSEFYNTSKSFQRRTINISDCCVRTTDWDIWAVPGDERYLRLVQAGESAARQYLANYKPPLIKPLIPIPWYIDRWWRSFTSRMKNDD